MSVAAGRRFPYAPGALGWVGAGFMFVALLCQVGAGILLMLLVVNRNGRVVIPMIGVFLLSFPILGVTMALWRIAWKRAGIVRPTSSIPKERREAMIRAMLIMSLASVLGVGGFVLLTLRLSGERRFLVGMVPLFLSSIASHYAAVKMGEARGVPSRGFLGWRPRHEVAVFTVVALAISALAPLGGLFWIPD